MRTLTFLLLALPTFLPAQYWKEGTIQVGPDETPVNCWIRQPLKVFDVEKLETSVLAKNAKDERLTIYYPYHLLQSLVIEGDSILLWREHKGQSAQFQLLYSGANVKLYTLVTPTALNAYYISFNGIWHWVDILEPKTSIYSIANQNCGKFNWPAKIETDLQAIAIARYLQECVNSTSKHHILLSRYHRVTSLGINTLLLETEPSLRYPTFYGNIQPPDYSSYLNSTVWLEKPIIGKFPQLYAHLAANYERLRLFEYSGPDSRLYQAFYLDNLYFFTGLHQAANFSGRGKFNIGMGALLQQPFQRKSVFNPASSPSVVTQGILKNSLGWYFSVSVLMELSSHFTLGIQGRQEVLEQRWPRNSPSSNNTAYYLSTRRRDKSRQTLQLNIIYTWD